MQRPFNNSVSPVFKLAEENVFNAQTDLLNTDRYDFLLKLFDRAEVIN